MGVSGCHFTRISWLISLPHLNDELSGYGEKVSRYKPRGTNLSFFACICCFVKFLHINGFRKKQ